MSLIKKNVIANFIGTAWQSIMALLFIPLYIKFMGIESYGLIGIFTTLQVVFSILDMGLSSTLNREMARLSVIPDKEQEMRNLVRTLELLYWSMAIFVGIIVMSLSPFIVRYWINVGQLSVKTVEQVFLIMGLAMALQMLVGFYSGGLMGLQKQVMLNIVNVIIGTLRGGGAVLILWLVSPTIQAFFLWQIFTSALNILLLALLLWRNLPHGNKKAIFEKQLLKGIWKFAVGMSGITLMGVILTQMDKIILSKLLTLEMFGYYTLASVVAMSLGRLFTPVFYSIYPRLTQLVSINDQDELKRFYHKSSQFISVLILPIAIVVALFSYDILLLWTKDPVTTEKTYLLVSILICGTAINGLLNPPYALQLASGWTKLSFLKNVIAVIIFIPSIIYITIHYGVIGAAIVWFVLNLSWFIIEIPIMHHRLLRKEKWRWYWQDVFIPLISCLFVAGLGRIIIRGSMSNFEILLYITLILILTFVIAVIITPFTRALLFKNLLKIKNVKK